jgi:hypothetical protein
MGASLSAEQAIRELVKHIPELLRLPIRTTTIRDLSSTSRARDGNPEDGRNSP